MTTSQDQCKAKRLDKKLNQMTESDRNQLASQNFNKMMESDDLNNRQINNLMDATSSSETGKSGQSYSLYNTVNKIGE